jgi:hypothetical protein
MYKQRSDTGVLCDGWHTSYRILEQDRAEFLCLEPAAISRTDTGYAAPERPYFSSLPRCQAS